MDPVIFGAIVGGLLGLSVFSIIGLLIVKVKSLEDRVAQIRAAKELLEKEDK